MSWGAVPWWIYQLEYEHRECLWTCCFPEEYLAGFTRSTPDYVISLRKNYKILHDQERSSNEIQYE